MRLLLYFLALLTGFSAAEAARPVEAASSTSAASQVEQAEAFASAVYISVAIDSHFAADRTWPLVEHQTFAAAASAAPVSTPVSRADSARE